MDPQLPNSSQPPGIKPGVPGSSPPTPVGFTRVAVRKYPKPPPLMVRLVILCLRPESWAETARYPTHVTLLALLAAILLSAVAIAYGETARFSSALYAFANSYQSQGYPELELKSDATLAARGPLSQPIRIDLPNLPLYVDPTGTTTPETVKVNGLFITSGNIVLLTETGPAVSFTLATFLQGMQIDLPVPGKSKVINGATITAFLNDRQFMFFYWGLGTFTGQLIGDCLWAALMLFLLSPLIRMTAAGPRLTEGPDRRLLIPRRAAVRMAAGLIVPIIFFNAVLRASGHPIQAVLGEWSFLFWFLACASLSIWTGILARRMYMPKVVTRRSH